MDRRRTVRPVTAGDPVSAQLLRFVSSACGFQGYESEATSRIKSSEPHQKAIGLPVQLRELPLDGSSGKTHNGASLAESSR